MKAEITRLGKELYYSKREARDRENYIGEIEKRIQEYDEIIFNLKQRIKNITSRGNSPVPYNMANIDPFVNINRGLTRLENHFLGITPLNNPVNIVQGINGSLNTIRADYQRKVEDLDDVIAQRDIQNDQIAQLQIDINWYRQRDTDNQNEINRLTQEYDAITMNRNF